MKALTICNTAISKDAQGRYSLNDLHAASGGENKHRPSLWLSNAKTKELIEEIESEAGIPALVSNHGGSEQGSYAAKELVYSYAMWISPKFNLHVIRAYDDLVNGRDTIQSRAKAAHQALSTYGKFRDMNKGLGLRKSMELGGKAAIEIHGVDILGIMGVDLSEFATNPHVERALANPVETKLNKLVAYLKQHGGESTRRDALRYMRGTASDLNELLYSDVAHGVIEHVSVEDFNGQVIRLVGGVA